MPGNDRPPVPGLNQTDLDSLKDHATRDAADPQALEQKFQALQEDLKNRRSLGADEADLAAELQDLQAFLVEERLQTLRQMTDYRIRGGAIEPPDRSVELQDRQSARERFQPYPAATAPRESDRRQEQPGAREQDLISRAAGEDNWDLSSETRPASREDDYLAARDDEGNVVRVYADGTAVPIGPAADLIGQTLEQKFQALQEDLKNRRSLGADEADLAAELQDLQAFLVEERLQTLRQMTDYRIRGGAIEPPDRPVELQDRQSARERFQPYPARNEDPGSQVAYDVVADGAIGPRGQAAAHFNAAATAAQPSPEARPSANMTQSQPAPTPQTPAPRPF
jgi:hypothetical protein